MRKLTIALLVVFTLPVLALPTQYSTDFEGFSTTAPYIVAPNNGVSGSGGTIHGQDGWTANEVHVGIDEQVMDIGGNTVLRLSNGAGSGNYTGTHPSPTALQMAGESATGASLNRFQFSLDFKSVSDSVQEGLSIDITPYEWGTASRHGILRITDNSENGLSLGWWEYDNAFNYTTIASGLDRSEWHNIAVDMLFVEGQGNDVVNISFGNDTTTLTTWESYYAVAGDPQPNYAGVNSVIFRTPTANSDLMNGGIYFDNFSMAVVPEPTTIALLGLGGLALIRKKRSA